jgi:DNA helicase INO80
MPSLFDSHDEFNEWFSKDVEGAAEKGNSRLSEHQLRRLHMILKPFMLRRVKRHVQNELGEKIEEDLFVDLTHRQRNMYRSLLSDQSVRELLRRAKTSHDGPDVETSRYLMNVAMQFRKVSLGPRCCFIPSDCIVQVCNHPELFARADVDAPYSFVSYGRSGPLRRDVDVIHAPYSSKNPIDYSIPELFYLDGGLVDVPREDSSMKAGPGVLAHLMNVWSPETIVRSLSEPGKLQDLSLL